MPLLNEYAAEGLVDSAKLTSVLSTVGVGRDVNKQDSVEAALLAWITSSGARDESEQSGDA